MRRNENRQFENDNDDDEGENEIDISMQQADNNSNDDEMEGRRVTALIVFFLSLQINFASSLIVRQLCIAGHSINVHKTS